MTSTLISLLATLAAAAAAAFSYLAVRALRRQTEAQVVLGCLQAYSSVRRRRQKAVQADSADECKEYYRELCDLHWSEYSLYRNRHLSASIMRFWLDARWRDFQNDTMTVRGPGGNAVSVSYADQWRQLVADKYFAPSDRFVDFMNLVHEGKIEEALKCQ
jgi:hypothetical protein